MVKKAQAVEVGTDKPKAFIRFGERPEYKMPETPVRAIRHMCLECTCEQEVEVRLRPDKIRPLWRYRMGRNPARKGMGNAGFLIKNNAS